MITLRISVISLHYLPGTVLNTTYQHTIVVDTFIDIMYESSVSFTTKILNNVRVNIEASELNS